MTKLISPSWYWTLSTSASTASSTTMKINSSFTALAVASAGFLSFFMLNLIIFSSGEFTSKIWLVIVHQKDKAYDCVRVGGRENYFHCGTCDMCLPNHLHQVPFLIIFQPLEQLPTSSYKSITHLTLPSFQAHKCVEKVSRSNCPVCLVIAILIYAISSLESLWVVSLHPWGLESSSSWTAFLVSGRHPHQQNPITDSSLQPPNSQGVFLGCYSVERC